MARIVKPYILDMKYAGTRTHVKALFHMSATSWLYICTLDVRATYSLDVIKVAI